MADYRVNEPSSEAGKKYIEELKELQDSSCEALVRNFSQRGEETTFNLLKKVAFLELAKDNERASKESQ